MFFLNVTYSGVNFPVILNKCILPAVLHHFNSTSDMKCITFAALEYNFPLNSFNFLPLKIKGPMITCNEMANMCIVYH